MIEHYTSTPVCAQKVRLSLADMETSLAALEAA